MALGWHSRWHLEWHSGISRNTKSAEEVPKFVPESAGVTSENAGVEKGGESYISNDFVICFEESGLAFVYR
nr:hypothetical protein [Eubacterium sp.]